MLPASTSSLPRTRKRTLAGAAGTQRERRARGLLRSLGEAFARAGDLRAARFVALDLGTDFGHYGGDEEQLAQLSIYVAILEASSPH